MRALAGAHRRGARTGASLGVPQQPPPPCTGLQHSAPEQTAAPPGRARPPLAPSPPPTRHDQRQGMWAELLGFGDYYYELGVQILEACVASRPLNGGLMELGALK